MSDTVTSKVVLDRLRAYARVHGLTKTRFAEIAGLRDTVLRNFWEDDWSPNFATVRKLESVVPEDFSPEPERESA